MAIERGQLFAVAASFAGQFGSLFGRQSLCFVEQRAFDGGELFGGRRPSAGRFGFGQVEVGVVQFDERLTSHHAITVSDGDASDGAVERCKDAAALDDAGLAAHDVDGLCLYDVESNTIADVVTMLGLEGVRFFSTHSHGGGSYCAVVTTAAAAITSGHATAVLAFRARNRGRRSSAGTGMMDGGRPWEKIAPHAMHEMNAYGKWMAEAGTSGPYAPIRDAKALRYIRDHTTIPVASCECLFGRRDYRPYFEHASVDVAIIDTPWNGVAESTDGINFWLVKRSFFGQHSKRAGVGLRLCAPAP